MEPTLILSLTTNFESHVNHTNDGIEFWLARDLQFLLGYDKWDNFFNVITKAKTACELSGQTVSDHFADVGKKVFIGSGAENEIPESLPAEEDIQKIERKLVSENKTGLKNSSKIRIKK